MTNRDDGLLFRATPVESVKELAEGTDQLTLRQEVKRAVGRYFLHLDGQAPDNLYQLVINEIEAPLLEVVMQQVDNNQSKAATMLGINRGTLRSKLKQYGML